MRQIIGKKMISFVQVFRKVYIPGKKTSYEVQFNRRKILVCSCLESTFEGLPCRHELCILNKEMKPMSSLNINKRWEKSYFNQGEVSDVSEDEESSDEEEEEDSGSEDNADEEGISSEERLKFDEESKENDDEDEDEGDENGELSEDSIEVFLFFSQLKLKQ